MPINNAAAIICDWDGNIISAIYPNELEYDPLEYRLMLERAANMIKTIKEAK